MSPSEWRRVQRVRDLVDGALPPRVRQGMVGWQAIELWPEIAGEQAARRSAAITFRDGRLTVEVVNSVWMHRLSASTRRMLRDLNDALGSPIVSEIVYRVNPNVITREPASGKTE